MSQSKPIRWGILSTAGIARKNWRAIAKSQTGYVSAVASRNKNAAEQFIRECQGHTPQSGPTEAVGSYQALLERDDVDAVYIPLPTAMRKEWIILAAKAGKHVLAEKPAALTATELEEALDQCAKNKVQYMDGVMFMHSQRLPLLRSVLDSAAGPGTLRRIATHFSFQGDDEFRSSNIRVDTRYEPHGCLGDLGWYCIRFILWAKQYKVPTHVQGRILSTLRGNESPGTVPGEFSAEMSFDDGTTANFYCSFITNHQQWSHLSGDDGFVRLDDFVLPYHGSEVNFVVGKPEFSVDGCDFHMKRNDTVHRLLEYSSGHRSAQEVSMFETFHRIVSSKTLDPSWGEITLATQRVMDRLMESATLS